MKNDDCLEAGHATAGPATAHPVAFRRHRAHRRIGGEIAADSDISTDRRARPRSPHSPAIPRSGVASPPHTQIRPAMTHRLRFGLAAVACELRAKQGD